MHSIEPRLCCIRATVMLLRFWFFDILWENTPNLTTNDTAQSQAVKGGNVHCMRGPRG